MHLGIFHLLPDLRTHNIDLLLRIAQRTGEKTISKSFETFHDLEVVPGADFFLQNDRTVSSTYIRLDVENLLTRCLSAGQVPTGQTCLSAATSLKPASFNQPSRRGPGQGSMPPSLEALRNVVLKCLEARSGVRELSGECHSRSRSMHSTQPPGVVCLVKY